VAVAATQAGSSKGSGEQEAFVRVLLLAQRRNCRCVELRGMQQQGTGSRSIPPDLLRRGAAECDVCVPARRRELSPKCKKEELRLSALQSRDVRLRPKLMRACQEELVMFCGEGVQTGGGRKFQCLLENVQQPTFSGSCRAEVLKREDRAKDDYRLDAGVVKACEGEIEAQCAEAVEKEDGNASVLLCMVNLMVSPGSDVSDACQKEMSRCAPAHLPEACAHGDRGWILWRAPFAVRVRSPVLRAEW
jgi:Cysteine rich repeat